MDDNLREIGIGDLKVPKEMQRMGEAFYGRAQAYRAALAAKDDAGAGRGPGTQYLWRGAGGRGAARLAAYMREALRGLAGQDASRLAGGELHFPDPAAVPDDRDLRA